MIMMMRNDGLKRSYY